MRASFTKPLQTQICRRLLLLAIIALTWGLFHRTVDATKVRNSTAIVLASEQNIDDRSTENLTEETTPKKKKPDMISVRPFLSVDKLPPGGECEILIYVTVKEGWHINANPAMPDNFIPTTVTMKSKQKCELISVKYPKSHPMTLAGIDEPVHTYDGRIAIRGVIGTPITAAGQVDDLEIHVRYQACNDKSCLSPTTLTFKTKVPVAGIGEEVKAVNQNLFLAEDKKEAEESEQK